jgi:hypothetical protein
MLGAVAPVDVPHDLLPVSGTKCPQGNAQTRFIGGVDRKKHLPKFVVECLRELP